MLSLKLESKIYQNIWILQPKIYILTQNVVILNNFRAKIQIFEEIWAQKFKIFVNLGIKIPFGPLFKAFLKSWIFGTLSVGSTRFSNAF